MTNSNGQRDLLSEFTDYRMARNQAETGDGEDDEEQEEAEYIARLHQDEREDSEDEEEDDEEDGESLEDIKTYKQVFKGHKSSSTIKAVNFYGPRSEYVISGSDDAQIFIWDKKTGKLLRMLEGHARVVNCVEPHPSDPLIATSGIDVVVKLWGSNGAYPSQEKIAHCQKRMEKIAKYNTEALKQEEEREGMNFCSQQ